jgi:hypothetical protein
LVDGRSAPILGGVTPPENRIPRAQARREMALTLAVLVVIVAVVFGEGLVIGVVEALGPWGTTAVIVGGTAVLIRSRRRRGAGWVIARGILVAVAIALGIVALSVGVCVATQCVR